MSTDRQSLETFEWSDWWTKDRMFVVISAVAAILAAISAELLAPPASYTVASVLFLVSLAAFVRFRWL